MKWDLRMVRTFMEVRTMEDRIIISVVGGLLSMIAYHIGFWRGSLNTGGKS